MMRLSPLPVLAGLILPLLLAACAAPTADRTAMTYDKQFDFSGASSFYIEPFSRTDPATITVSDRQIERINTAIGAELERKGFAVVKKSGKADLFLTWYLITEDQGEASDRCPDCDGYYAKGTLIVDMIDPMRNQPVWRSVLHTELTAEPGTASAEQARQSAAAAVFAQFPPQ